MILDTILTQDTIHTAASMLSLDNLGSTIKSTISSNQFFQGGMILGAITAVLIYLKGIPIGIYHYIKKMLYYELIISQSEDARLFVYFDHWYSSKYPKKYRKVMAHFKDNGQGMLKSKYSAIANNYKQPVTALSAQNAKNSYDQKFQIELKQTNDLNYIWYGGKLLVIHSNREKLDGAMDPSMSHYITYNIAGFFAKRAVDKILNELVELRRLTEKEIPGIVAATFDEEGYANTKTIYTYKKFENLFFKEKKEFITYVEKFKNKAEQSTSRGCKHKTGIKLYGPPGTGKTSIATAVAHHLGYKLALINILALKSDNSLTRIAEGIDENTVVLFEDIDDSFGENSRSNDRTKTGTDVTFSTVLQVLDGILSPENVIFIFTTNKPDQLDDALYRDGRINKIIEIGYPRYQDVIDFVNNFYDASMPQHPYVVGRNLEDKSPITLATVEKYCMELDDQNSVLNKILEHETRI